MRIQAAVVVLILTLVSSVHVTGQQEALPAVKARTTSSNNSAPADSVTPLNGFVREEPTVVLPLVPLHENMTEPSLNDAARNHDYETFHEQYTLARARGERVAQYDALHELWSWSMSSPTGAFYGPDLHARIAAAYPGFARYIDDYKIVDRNGNVFYPTAETRAFLLEQAQRNTTAPRVQIARSEPRETTTIETPRPTTRTQRAPLAPARSRSRARMQKAEVTKPAVTPKPVEPVVAKPEPVQVATTAPAQPPVVAEPVPAPVQPQQPVATLATSVPTPVQPIDPAKAAPANRTGGRAALMIIIGLLGAGILAVLLRAPKEEPITVLPKTEAPKTDTPKQDVAKVEPIRKAESAAPSATPQQPNGKKTRANGSHR